MTAGGFLGLIPATISPHPTVIELVQQLEENGWKAQKCINGKAIRLWPENQRPRAITIDLTYPVNEHKLDFWREHTGLDLTLTTLTPSKEES